jgi:hypothetical protein
MEEKVSREIAERDFETFCTAARINVERYKSDAEAEAFISNKEIFIEGVMSGKIIVDENGWPTVMTDNEEMKEIRFSRRPKGFDRVQMDKVHADALHTRIFAWIASLTGKSSKRLQELEEHDLSFLEAVFHLFRDA